MNNVQNFDRLAFFGDSLTDTGGLFDLTSDTLTSPLPPENLEYVGQFSNGEVYTEIAPNLLNIDNVDNFALGGAAALGEVTLGALLNSTSSILSLIEPDADPALLDQNINLNGQVDRFLEETPDTDNTAASFFIGLGDFGRFMPTSPDTAPTEIAELASDIAAGTLSEANRVIDAGVDTIILNTLPLGSFFPFSNSPVSTDPAFTAHNDALRAGVDGLSNAGADVIVVDFAAIAEEIVADPSSFGFVAPLTTVKYRGIGTNPIVTDTPDGPELSFEEDPTSLPNLDQQVFLDLVHPTTATHGVFGAFYSESLTSNVQILGRESDEIEGSESDDLVLSGLGDDDISLNDGNDVALGGLGNDSIRSGSGNNIFSLGSGDDMGIGGFGNDIVAGGVGNDTLLGRSGNDVLIDGLGSDNVSGEEGNDIFVYSEPSLIGGAGPTFQDVFDGGSGEDTLFLSLTDSTRESIQGSDDMERALDGFGISINNIEEIQFIDSPSEILALETDALVAEADLWGLI